MNIALRWVENRITPGLSRLEAAASDLRPALVEFGIYMIGSIDRNFREQGREFGVSGRWPALSARSIAQRRAGQRARPRILQQTGTLRRSTAFEATRTDLAVGTNVPYAPDHHQGGAWGTRRHVTRDVPVPAHTRTGRSGTTHAVRAHTRHESYWLPARPIYLFQPQDFARLEGILIRRLKAAAAGRWGGAS